MTSSKSCSVISRKAAALTMPANTVIKQLHLIVSLPSRKRRALHQQSAQQSSVPALATVMSKPPNSCTAAATAASTSSLTRTSHLIAAAWYP